MSISREMSLIETMSSIADAFMKLVGERKRVEIYFHPGWDPDAEASVRLVYAWAEKAGAESIKIFHLGDPKHLVAIEDHLEVISIEDGFLLKGEDDSSIPVTVVLDVSNPQFLAAELSGKLRRADFLFDHHQPSRTEVFIEEDKVVGGVLVVPKYGCTALLVDHLMQAALGNSVILSRDADLAGLVWAAFLSDQGAQRKDDKPAWLTTILWDRLAEIKDWANENIIIKLTVDPWAKEEYVQMLSNAFTEENLDIRNESSACVLACVLGDLGSAVRRPWIGHTADLVIAKRPVVRANLPDDDIDMVCILGAFSDLGQHGAVMVSLRTSENIDAGKAIRVLTKGEGGGREKAAAAVVFMKEPGDLLAFAQNLKTELMRNLKPCIRNAASK